jgi:5-methylcytosine-specific restriction endonuclease McrA
MSSKIKICFASNCEIPCDPNPYRAGFFTYCLTHQQEYNKKKNQKWRDKNPKAYKEQVKRNDARQNAKPERKKAQIAYARVYQAKPEVRQRTKELRAKNRYVMKWRAKNLDKARAYGRKQQHERRAVSGVYTEDQLQARINFYGGRCYLCGCDWNALPTKSDAKPKECWKTIDHVIPVSCGGSSWPANLRPACNSCNSSKNNKTRPSSLSNI